MSTIYHAAIPVDLAAPSRQRIGAAQMFMGDNDSHIFTALVADTDAPEAGLRAGTVSGTALRADGVTVALEGTKGAEAQEVTFPNGITAQATPCSVTLPQAAFAVPGSLLISIKLTDGTTATTVLALSGTVIRTETDAAVDPGELIPDLATLQAAATQALDAAETANEAAAAAAEAAVHSASKAELKASDFDTFGGFAKGKTLSTGHYITGGGNWSSNSNAYYACIPIKQNDVVTITAGRETCYYAFLAADYSGSSSVAFATGETGRRTLTPGVTITHVAPASSAYLYCLYEMDPSSPAVYLPASVTVNYQEYAVPLRLEGYENMISCAMGEPALYRGYMITSNNVWFPGDYSHLLIPIKQGDVVTVLANKTSGSHIAFIAEPCRGAGAVAFAYTATGRIVLSAGQRASYTVPAAGNYLYALNMAGAGDYRPADIFVNGVSVFGSAKRYIRGVFQYASGSYMSGQATERLIVAMPQGGHYTGFTMYHYVVSSINCDVWRIQSFNTYDDSLTVLRELSTNGELECAVRLDGRSDFSGGSTHGDEVMTGWDVFLDGQRITDSLSSYTAVTPFEELRLVRQSNLYDPADSTTLIALHGCEYVYSLEGLTVNQSLEWKVAETLSACYMAMFTPKKTVTNSLYSDLDFTPITLESSSYSISKAGARKAVIYDKDGSFWACFRAERYPSGLTGGDKLLITDNGGNSYNKLYYILADGGASTVGELWQTTTVYEIKA